jgi:hypothetical protein
LSAFFSALLVDGTSISTYSEPFSFGDKNEDEDEDEDEDEE